MPITLNGTTGITTPDLDSTGDVTANGLSTPLRPLISGTAQASTSGTAIDFTGIPSWVKRVTVMFNGVSTNGASPVQVQIGSGSITTSGYSASVVGGASGVVASLSTTGLRIDSAPSAAWVRGGVCQIILISGSNYVMSASTNETSAGVFSIANGNVTLSGTLDRVRITTVNGTDTFDAGTINIMWE